MSGDEGALQITAIYASKPSAVEIGAQVSGDFGGSVSDIADGQFSSAGALSIETQGSPATFASDSFLTVPEPGGAVLSSVACLALLGAGFGSAADQAPDRTPSWRRDRVGVIG
jgi:hypothetical protein